MRSPIVVIGLMKPPGGVKHPSAAPVIEMPVAACVEGHCVNDDGLPIDVAPVQIAIFGDVPPPVMNPPPPPALKLISEGASAESPVPGVPEVLMVCDVPEIVTDELNPTLPGPSGAGERILIAKFHCVDAGVISALLCSTTEKWPLLSSVIDAPLGVNGTWHGAFPKPPLKHCAWL